MHITWLGIAAVLFLLFFVVNGLNNGFVKEVVSALFIVLAIVIVTLVNPYVNSFIKEQTGVYNWIEEGCEEFVSSKVDEVLASGNNLQENIVDALKLPDFITKSLLKNNTQDVYNMLDADTFIEYIAGYLATTAVNGMSFALSYLIAILVIKIIAYALDVMTKLPVLHGINAVAGGLVGGVKGLSILWVIFLIITVICSTHLGQKALEVIGEDSILNFLYNTNVLIKFFGSIFYGG